MGDDVVEFVCDRLWEAADMNHVGRGQLRPIADSVVNQLRQGFSDESIVEMFSPNFGAE